MTFPFSKVDLVAMPLLLALYWMALTSTVLLAFRVGSAPECAGAIILLAGSIATKVATTGRSGIYQSIEWNIFFIDLAVFTLFLVVALRANRKWPLCSCGMQLIGLLGHIAKVLAPVMSPFTYSLMTGFWSYPIMASIVVGSIRHRRRRQTNGVDLSWLT